MTKFFLRIITVSDSQDTAEEILAFLRALPVVAELRAEPIKSYWKNPEQGELLCSFASDHPIEDIRVSFADHWACEAADARWAHILVPHSMFLWLTM